ncbi:coiled-coil domain-containing protein 25 [Xylaria arbuscula]|nr:coiled-coil domain-containing protein 25 [Xylaria arbuscula]
MVYYFTSNVVTPSAYVYVGKDKFENEELIKHGWEEDVWFHVDKLSSAHIYLRLREGDSWESIPEALVTDLGQLTKANSIEGNKKDNITIIYTPWSNLKKDGSMAVGQVSFKDPRKVKRVLITQRENAIVNRLNKTRVEKTQPDLFQEKEDHLRQLRKKDQIAKQERKKEEARIAQERAEKKWQKDHAYDELFSEENIASSSNQNTGEDWEDDFM